MAIHYIFILIYLVVGFGIDPSMINYILITQCILSIYQRQKSKNEVLSPLIIFYLSTIMVSIGNVSLINIIGTAENKSYAYIVPKYLSESCVIWAVGSSIIFVGYLMFERFSMPKVRYDLNKKSANTFFWIVLILSVLAPFTRVALASLGSITKLINLSGAIGILFFSRLWAAEGNTKYRNFAVTLFVIQTYNALVYAWVRFELIQPTIVMLLGYLAGSNRIRSLVSPRMLPFIALVAIFIGSFSALSGFRGNYAKSITYELFGDKKAKQSDVFGYETENKTSFIVRLSCLSQITNIVKLVDKQGFYNGTASYPIVIALIPRFLWPEKPAIELGLWFALEIGAAYKEQGTRGNNSINMTVMGELFLDFGWAGIVAGCLLFGGYVAMLWNSIDFQKFNYNILGILYGGYLLVYSFYAPTLDLQLIITFTSIYLLLLLLNRLLLRNKQTT